MSMKMMNIFWIFKSFLVILSCVVVVPVDAQESEILLEFKKGVVDVNGNLKNWRSLDSTPCHWNGISCVNSTVVSIDLHAFNLSGNLPTDVCKLQYLTFFNVSKNMFSGPIPIEFASWMNLEVLDLSTNNLHGEIPSELCLFPHLRMLFLSENFLYGEIPSEIGNLTSLEELVIYSNNLTGPIPSSIRMLKKLRVIRAGLNVFSGPIPVRISECVGLEVLGLAQNRFVGFIPRELHNLKNLTTLVLWQNLLSGEIPPELGNCSRLQMIALNDNDFTGSIPKELGKLSTLKRLYLYRNKLSGPIPKELGNCESVVEIDFSENALTGTIPIELGRIPSLRLLHLFENLLEGNIPRELGQLSQLRQIDLSINNLTGTIPLAFQNITTLEYLQLFSNSLEGIIPPLLGTNNNLSVLDLSDNILTGTIPPHLCKYEKLILLSLGSNSLVGNIPHGVKTCKSLVQLMLGGNLLTGNLPVELSQIVNLSALEMNKNRLSGPIIPEIGKLKKLTRLFLSDNYFIRQIPPDIGELTELVFFNISSNHLSGDIPRELAICTKLQRLDLSRNRFIGHVPKEIGNLVNLELLMLSNNYLNGTIPESLGNLFRLTELQMGGNLFSGTIPSKLGQLTALQISLNVSYNNLTGGIPSELGSLQMLETLYLNNNQLDGEVPSSFNGLSSLLACNLSHNNLAGSLPSTPVFQRMDISNFLGNDGLCGMHLRDCQLPSLPSDTSELGPSSKDPTNEKIISLAATIVGFVSLILTVGVCWALKQQPAVPVLCEDRNDNLTCIYYFPKDGFTYHELRKATNNFSDSSIIGRGACGTVYKAVMSDGLVIAVKKLKLHGEGSAVDNSFRAEISTLGNARHCNIVKLYGFCYHQDSNLILYEYMANGSLGEMLHVNEETCLLDWNTRYKIALGAAEGLRYLHCYCKPQIIHRDIKSNNILLDEAWEAHVGDFGLAKLIDISNSKTMSAVAGSYGYIAPEYAFTMKVTEKCDIYSFGVVLLELITGQSPIQPLERGGDLVNWVRSSIQNMKPTSEIFDHRLDLSSKKTVEEMSLILKIALFCTSESPFDRPTMKEVIAMMIDARVSSCSLLSSPTSETPLENASSEAEDAYSFLVNWLKRFPQYRTNDFYIAGESYAGHYVPQLAELVYERNKAKEEYAHINFKGFIVGNPETDDYFDMKGLVEYAWSHTVISDQIYAHVNRVCNFRLFNWTNDCIVAMSSVFHEYNKIDIYNIYVSKCNAVQRTSSNIAIKDLSRRMRIPAGYDPCFSNYVEEYFNRADVKRAFHANVAGKNNERWKVCNDSILNAYNLTVFSVLPIYSKLIKEVYIFAPGMFANKDFGEKWISCGCWKSCGCLVLLQEWMQRCCRAEEVNNSVLPSKN